jgi:hypothetical protein
MVLVEVNEKGIEKGNVMGNEKGYEKVFEKVFEKEFVKGLELVEEKEKELVEEFVLGDMTSERKVPHRRHNPKDTSYNTDMRCTEPTS